MEQSVAVGGGGGGLQLLQWLPITRHFSSSRIGYSCILVDVKKDVEIVLISDKISRLHNPEIENFTSLPHLTFTSLREGN